ncbi:unnamed protein product [Brassica rapa subsp. trilocularis]
MASKISKLQNQAPCRCQPQSINIVKHKMAWNNRFLQNLHHALTLSSKNHQEVERLLMPQKDGDR